MTPSGERSSTDEKPEADMPLGARIHRLQRIAADLDREDIELEDAMRLFEEGVAHLRAAESLVKQAEVRIERLLEDNDGVRTEKLNPDE
jgi:exodeoxyribonuclease VII small subunit